MVLFSKKINEENICDLTDEELESAFEKANEIIESLKSEGRRRMAERRSNFEGAMAFIRGYK